MKQYTSPEQTAKLIELGFVPTGRIKEVRTVHLKVEVYHDCNFTIGELIEMLPPRIKGINLSIDRYYEFEQWLVYWNAGDRNQFFRATELIDALYNAIIELKEEEVI